MARPTSGLQCFVFTLQACHLAFQFICALVIAVGVGIIAIKGMSDDISVESSTTSPFCTRLRGFAFLQEEDVNFNNTFLDIDTGVEESLTHETHVDAKTAKASLPCDETSGPWVASTSNFFGRCIAAWVAWMFLTTFRIYLLGLIFVSVWDLPGAVVPLHVVAIWLEFLMLVMSIVGNMILSPILSMETYENSDSVFVQYSETVWLMSIIMAFPSVVCAICSGCCCLNVIHREEDCEFILRQDKAETCLFCCAPAFCCTFTMILACVIVFLSQYGLFSFTVVLSFRFDIHLVLSPIIVASLGIVKLISFLILLPTLAKWALSIMTFIIRRIANIAPSVGASTSDSTDSQAPQDIPGSTV